MYKHVLLTAVYVRYGKTSKETLFSHFWQSLLLVFVFFKKRIAAFTFLDSEVLVSKYTGQRRANFPQAAGIVLRFVRLLEQEA